jgi:hypothetical protein
VLDESHRHLVTLGLGGASLTQDSEELDLHGNWVVTGAYDHRLTGSDAPVGVFARAAASTVLGTSANGAVVARPCHLFWAMAGPSIVAQVPARSELSFVADAGAALAHVSRSGCSDSGKSAANVVTPQLGGVLQVATSPRSAFKFGARFTRLPLGDLGVGSESRWIGSSELSLAIAF